MEKTLEIFDALVTSPHEEEVKDRFLKTYLKGLSNSNTSKVDWERLCDYAYGLITKPSRVYSVPGELILSQIASLQKSIYMRYFNSGWISQILNNASDGNNVGLFYQQLRALIKIIKYKQEVASVSNDPNDLNDLANVENDCRLLQSFAIKCIGVVKGRIDWMQLFVSMFTDLPQSIPKDHVKLIEVLLYSLAIPESDSLEDNEYNEFVKQSVNLIESLWQRSQENIGITIREVFVRLSSNQTCSKSIVLLISKLPKSCTSVILPYVKKVSADDVNNVKKFEVCVERMISMIPHQFADKIGCWIIELVKALEKLQDNILIRIARTNTTRCFKYLLNRHARSDALMVVKYLLLGYQVASDIFYSIVPIFPEVLENIAQEGGQDDTLLELSKIAQCLIQRFPSGGNKYLQLSKTLKSLKLPELKQDEISDILRKSVWFKKTNVADGRKEIVVKTSVHPSSQIQKKKGLQNLGNTCFMNSVLQALFNSVEFRNRILQTTAKSKKTTIYQLQLCFAHMMISTKSYFSPSALLETLPNWLNNGRQQDCHEFLKILFSQIEEESKKSSLNKKPRLDSEEDMTDVPICPFGGKLENTIECLTCGNKSKTTEVFHDLSLSLKVDTSDNLSFPDLLSDFLSAEDLKGDNKYECEKCEGLRDAEKRTRISTPPRYLILSLNRFEYDVKYARRIKIMTHVSIQDSFQVNGIVNEDIQYDLSAIVIHSGSSAEYGHYFTYAKDEEDGKWYNYNDSYVSISSLSRIISEGEDFKSDTPYLLFFKQKNIINRKLSGISQSLTKEVEEYNYYNSDVFTNKDFSMDDVDKDENDPPSGFDYDKSIF